MSDVTVSIDTRVAMPTGYDADRMVRVVESAISSENGDGEWDIAIAFVGDLELQALHRDFMDDDSPTDIMTFPRDDDAPWLDDESPRGGDIAVSVDRAAAQCADEGWDVVRELEFLVIHGMLHLLGWDDATSEGRAAMLDRQRDILKQVTG